MGIKKPVKKYDVIESNYLENLIDQVNRKIKDGWIPQGALTYNEMTGYNGEHYLQAIIKRDEK